MVELLFEGWAQPNATSMATASPVALPIDLMETKARSGKVFRPVMIRDVYAHLS
jgi:hypothetical protein